MAVFRVNKTSNYTVISNTHFKEKEMSLKAKGLLSLMLSLPEEWDYSINGLATLSKDGKDSVMNTLTELEQFGYLKRTRLFDDKGRYAGYDYDIFENPKLEYPYSAFPDTEIPNAENPAQLKTKGSSTNKSNTDKSITKRPKTYFKKDFVPPTLEEVQTYCKSRNNNVDAQKFFDYFTASDWVDAKGNKVRNWKQKVITWESYGSKDNGTGKTDGDSQKQRVGHYL